MAGYAELLRMTGTAALNVLLSIHRMQLHVVRRVMFVSCMAVAAEVSLMAAITDLRTLANGRRMLRDPVHSVRALYAVTSITEGSPLGPRMARVALLRVLLVAGRMELQPVPRVRSGHLMTIIARAARMASQAALLTLLTDFLFVTLDPLGAEYLCSSVPERLVTGSAFVRCLSAVMACETHLHSRRILRGSAAAVSYLRVTHYASYVAVPVSLMSDLRAVVDDQIACRLMTTLALLITYPSVRL